MVPNQGSKTARTTAATIQISNGNNASTHLTHHIGGK